MRLQTALSFILLLSLFISCDSSTETENAAPYISLSIGDVRQYYSESDSSYSQLSIIGETRRTDGQKVFISEYIDGSSNRQFYNFIKDGYMYSTQLDTNSLDWNLRNNPFVEQRLAKLYPVEGDKWISIDGEDKLSYFRASFDGNKRTSVKIIKNVFSYTLDTMLIEYYAQGYGHMGITSFDGSNPSFVNYLKVNGREYGEYVPDTNMPKRNVSKISSVKRKVGFFGESFR